MSKQKPYIILGPSARKLCWNYDGVVIGGAVNFFLGETEELKDIDIIVPLAKWPEACRMIPMGAVANAFGGFKYKEGKYSYDVWPGDVAQTLLENYARKIKAYCPRTGVLVSTEVK